MPSADAVARYFLWLANESEEEPALITQMQLQKLVYLAQGWSLGVRGKPLFDERIEAWVHGPVTPSLRPSFASYNQAPIAVSEANPGDSLTPDERHHIHSVWDMYSMYSAAYLRDLTHRQSPWKNARKDVPTDARSNAEIPQADMAACFKDEYRRYLSKRGIDPVALDRSSRQASQDHLPTLDLTTGKVRE
ncbi:MAG: DUF4065 domain-containing protein [Phycisphaerales bacterium]